MSTLNFPPCTCKPASTLFHLILVAQHNGIPQSPAKLLNRVESNDAIFHILYISENAMQRNSFW